jgi:competence protein ComEC
MGQALEKPQLFSDKRGFVFTMGALSLLILVRLFFEYQSYQRFISKPFYFTHAKVIMAYEKTKNNRRYTVLKLKSKEGLSFYTTTYISENFNHKYLRLQLFPDKKIRFKEYLGLFYVRSKIKDQENLPSIVKFKLIKSVASNHSDQALASFYNAIFFATPLTKELRDKISLLGVSHLVALSGFHLGILWGLVYGILYFLYRPLQQKFFPYRHALFDVGLVTMSILFVYVWFVGAPPSLLRSFAMVFVGWGVLLLGLELISFTFLTTIMLILITLFPSLLVSLSFWLSVAGVFYIFLLLHYTKHLNRWIVSFLVLPIGIFILMLPVVHVVFGTTSIYQLLSPILSILFVPFYPLVMLLHLLGFGDLLDGELQWLFSLPDESREKLLPLWAMLAYVGVSVGAIYSKRVFYLLLVLSVLYMLYLFVPI